MDEFDRTDEFEAFASARWSDLVRTAYLMGCRPADAEDCAQAALTVVWRKWSRVTAAENPEAYAFRILINTVRKAQRRRWTGEHPAGDLAAEDHLGTRRIGREPVADKSRNAPEDDRDTSIDLRRALQAIPHEQRAVLVLRFLHDKSEAEVASILGVPAGTVKSRAARGIQSLRAEIRQEMQS